MQLNFSNKLTLTTMANTTAAFLASLILVVVSGFPLPQYGVATRPGPGIEAIKDSYFQYINVPQHKTYEWGYHRGNGINNFIEEFLSQKDHAFKAKVKWERGNEGLGEMFYDYNHIPKVEEPQRSNYSPPGSSYGPSKVIF